MALLSLKETKESEMTNTKIVGQLKDNLLSVLGKNLKDDELKNIQKILLEQNIISGSGRTSNAVIFKNENGDEFYPTLSFKPLIKEGVKIGTKSKKMEEFVEDFNGLKVSYLNDMNVEVK